MQWLIDLIIELISVRGVLPPSYVARTGLFGCDFELGDFTTDGNWYELDLSSIVPEHASYVVLHIKLASTNVASRVHWAHPDQPGGLCTCRVRTQVANVENGTTFPLGCNSDRKVQYRFAGGGYTGFWMSIKGWGF